MDARNQAAHRPFNHNLIIRETGLCIDDDDLRIQEIYQRLTTDKQRNNLIFDDILQALDVSATQNPRLFAAVPLWNENHSTLNGSFRTAAPAHGSMLAQA